jgi:hypothetical protein
MISLNDLWQLILRIIDTFIRLPSISGQSTVMGEGELGNWIDITFTSDRAGAVQLVRATWDWTGRSVWLDRDGGSFTVPENEGVTWYEFHFGSAPPDVDTQAFGFTARGFDSGDYFKFTMDLDRGPNGGTPLTSDYAGGRLRLEFNNGIVIDDVFDTPENEPWGSKAAFRRLFLRPWRPRTIEPTPPLAGSGA